MWALLFFGLVGVGLYDVEERTYNTEVVQVDDGIFLQREDDMIFMVRFQGGEISFRKYDWLQIAVQSSSCKSSWCIMMPHVFLFGVVVLLFYDLRLKPCIWSTFYRNIQRAYQIKTRKTHRQLLFVDIFFLTFFWDFHQLKQFVFDIFICFKTTGWKETSS